MKLIPFILIILFTLSGCLSIISCRHIWSSWNNEPCIINGTWYISSTRHCVKCELVEGKIKER